MFADLPGGICYANSWQILPWSPDHSLDFLPGPAEALLLEHCPRPCPSTSTGAGNPANPSLDPSVAKFFLIANPAIFLYR